MPVPLHKAKAECFCMPGHPAHIRAVELLHDGLEPVRELLGELRARRTAR